MTKYLLDANLSPHTAAFLRDTLGVDVVHQRDILPGSPSDAEIVAFAKRAHRVVITFDLGFGEQYHRREHGQLGVIVLRLRNQRRASVEQALARFFRDEAQAIDLDTSLVVVEEQQSRISRSA